MTRRQFLWVTGAGGDLLAVGGVAGCASLRGETEPRSGPRVVVVGGGWGGATAAKYVRLADPRVDVVLLEPPAYFKKAIEDYAAGRRASAEMEPFAKQVKQLGVDDVAGYFAAQRREPAPAAPDPAAVQRGRAAAGQCAACHGATGRGDPAKLVPPIAGQPAAYIRNQLLLFKADRRSPGDPELTKMKGILHGIPDAALADVAEYYSSLR